MKIPNKVKIGDYDYDIKICRRISWRNSNIVGQINYMDKTLKLKLFKGDARVNQENFFHEIAHGILKELEYNHPQISRFRSDESLVQEMGLMLRKTFLDLLKRQGEMNERL